MGGRQRGLAVDQRLAAGDQLALRIEHVEQRSEPFAVESIGLAERGFALLDRLRQVVVALPIRFDGDQRVLDLAERVEKRRAVFGEPCPSLGLRRLDFRAPPAPIEERQVERGSDTRQKVREQSTQRPVA